MTDPIDEADDVIDKADDLLGELDDDEDKSEIVSNSDSKDASSESYPKGKRTEDALTNVRKAGDLIGAVPALAVVGTGRFFGAILEGFVSRVPKGVSIAQNLHEASLRMMRKKADAQFVTYTIYGDGEVIPRPSGLDSESQRVETDNGEWWSAKNGVDLDRVGDTPVAWGIQDSHEMISPVRARLAEKIDSGPENWRVIREYPNGQVEDVQWGKQSPGPIGANGSPAIADGGVVNKYPQFDDVWVDLSNWVDGADGMVCSMRKAYETTHDKAGTEALKDQETRGRLAERFNDDQTKWAIYLVLALLGGLLLGLFGPAMAESLGGSAGEAASSATPMMLSILGGI